MSSKAIKTTEMRSNEATFAEVDDLERIGYEESDCTGRVSHVLGLCHRAREGERLALQQVLLVLRVHRV